MKMWQKIYLIIMILFLLIFNICNILVFWSGYDKSLSVIRNSCISQWRNVAVSLTEDLSELGESGEEEWELFQIYVSAYQTEDLAFELWKGNELRAKSALGTQLTYSATEGVLESDFLVKEEERERVLKKRTGQVVIQRLGEDKYSCTSGGLVGTEYQLVIYGRVTDVLDLWKTQIRFFILLELAASVLMALLLYGVTHRFLRPVSAISEAAARIAAGDYQYHIGVSGGDELSKLAEDMNRMADQVRRNMEDKEREAQTKQEFIDALSHELRTPMTSIRGYAQLMMNAHLAEDKKLQYLDYIVQESGRVISISEILRQVILLREERIDTEHVSLEEMKRRLERMAEIQFRDKPVELSVSVMGGEIQGNAALLELFFVNLIRNSYHACEPGGWIRADFTEEGAEIVDNGAGMTQECVAHIFEPFYREDKARSRELGGTGLGMYLCRQIADIHGWQMRIDSEKGSGTRIRIFFESNTLQQADGA